MKKIGFIVLGALFFIVAATFFCLTSREATYKDGIPFAVGPQSKTTDRNIGESCVAMGSPSVFVFKGWPFPTTKAATPCDPVRLVYPVGVALDTLLAALLTVATVLLVKTSMNKGDDEDEFEDERPAEPDEA